VHDVRRTTAHPFSRTRTRSASSSRPSVARLELTAALSYSPQGVALRSPESLGGTLELSELLAELLRLTSEQRPDGLLVHVLLHDVTVSMMAGELLPFLDEIGKRRLESAVVWFRRSGRGRP
jgi:hypothetical protein